MLRYAPIDGHNPAMLPHPTDFGKPAEVHFVSANESRNLSASFDVTASFGPATIN